MRNFNKLKVYVTGYEPEKPTAKKDPDDKHIISVDMKTNKVISTKSKAEEDSYNLFKNIKDCIDKGSVSLLSAAHLINLEIKKMYIVCTGDEHLDVETNQYLDAILFKSTEELIMSMISSNNTSSMSSLEGVINQTIANTVKFLDYEEQFDFDKMKATIAHIVEVFR